MWRKTHQRAERLLERAGQPPRVSQVLLPKVEANQNNLDLGFKFDIFSFWRLRAPSYFVNTETPEVRILTINIIMIDNIINNNIMIDRLQTIIRVLCCTTVQSGEGSRPTQPASWRRSRKPTSRLRWGLRWFFVFCILYFLSGRKDHEKYYQTEC